MVQLVKIVLDTSSGMMKMIRKEKYQAINTAIVTKMGCLIQFEYLNGSKVKRMFIKNLIAFGLSLIFFSFEGGGNIPYDLSHLLKMMVPYKTSHYLHSNPAASMKAMQISKTNTVYAIVNLQLCTLNQQHEAQQPLSGGLAGHV